MKIIYIHLFTFLLVCFACCSFAQTTQTEDPNDILDKLDELKPDKKASYKAGINYLSNNVFFGRADTVKTPTIISSMKYTFKSGIFLSASADYIPNRKTNKLDGGSASAGYDFDITDDFSAGISYTKLFYAANSTQIGSAIGSTISANFNYDIASIITPTVSVDYNILKQGFGHDIFLTAGLSHDFAAEGILGDKDLFIISPTAALNSGTQNFYDAYFEIKKYKLTAKAQALAAAAEKLIAKRKQQLSKFEMLDYELSAPIEYKTGALIMSFTPTYAIAENKLPPRISNGLATGNIFYFEVGAALKF